MGLITGRDFLLQTDGFISGGGLISGIVRNTGSRYSWLWAYLKKYISNFHCKKSCWKHCLLCKQQATKSLWDKLLHWLQKVELSFTFHKDHSNLLQYCMSITPCNTHYTTCLIICIFFVITSICASFFGAKTKALSSTKIIVSWWVTLYKVIPPVHYPICETGCWE